MITVFAAASLLLDIEERGSSLGTGENVRHELYIECDILFLRTIKTRRLHREGDSFHSKAPD